ncbi:hypothetical protein CUS_5663 [Ruminococcus albus 8]|uniref:Uncharacterized protein n=1 Tax=Ruminococcus albus 8 TaxID=246199 RepID=E9SF07_RUMAL|nr:hypothetical protein CUS_5663 [Ruminococcus albus 8]
MKATNVIFQRFRRISCLSDSVQPVLSASSSHRYLYLIPADRITKTSPDCRGTVGVVLRRTVFTWKT